jgi:hypothetical protein
MGKGVSWRGEGVVGDVVGMGEGSGEGRGEGIGERRVVVGRKMGVISSPGKAGYSASTKL